VINPSRSLERIAINPSRRTRTNTIRRLVRLREACCGHRRPTTETSTSWRVPSLRLQASRIFPCPKLQKARLRLWSATSFPEGRLYRVSSLVLLKANFKQSARILLCRNSKRNKWALSSRYRLRLNCHLRLWSGLRSRLSRQPLKLKLKPKLRFNQIRTACTIRHN